MKRIGGNRRFKFRKLHGGIVMKNADAVAGAHRLHLRHHAAAFIMPLHALTEFRGVVKCAAVDEIFHMGDEQTAIEIISTFHLAVLLKIGFGGIDAE